MFNFITTTIINSDKDLSSGRALYSHVAKDKKHDDILKIKRDFTFEKQYVTKIYKKDGSEPVFGEFTLDFAEIKKTIDTNAVYPIGCRLALYVALEGSEESIFANDFYQKGMPMSIGFIIKDKNTTPTELATTVKKNIERYNLSTVGKKLFTVEDKAGKLVFKCAEEYMRFKTIAVLQEEGDQEIELVHYFDGEDVAENPQKAITIVSRGENGFGTFRHLIKDLRLPTAMNTYWAALRQDDRPVVGAIYDQFIINYEAPSYTNPSYIAVGHKTDTATTHVFWVRHDLAKDFQTVIAAFIGSDAVKNDPKAIFEDVTDALKPEAVAEDPDSEDEEVNEDHMGV